MGTVLVANGELVKPESSRLDAVHREALSVNADGRRLPRVSVVLPVHNAEPFLGATLASISVQTLTDHEVVVVLNGCADASEGIAREHAACDPRVRLVELPRAGLVPALNCGLQEARAPIVARMDADDLMADTRLEQQVSALETHPDWTVVACGVRHASAEGLRSEGMERHVAWLNGLRTPEQIRAARFIDAPVAHPSVAYRVREVIGIGGYRDGDFPEDHDLWLRLLGRGLAIGKIPEVLVEWRDRPDRLTRADPRYREEAHRRLRHEHLKAGPLAKGRHCRIWGAGPFGRRHAKELRSLGVEIDDFIDIDPRKIGREVAGGLVVRGLESVGVPEGRMILLCVGSPGARDQIIGVLQARGHVCERDYVALQ